MQESKPDPEALKRLSSVFNEMVAATNRRLDEQKRYHDRPGYQSHPLGNGSIVSSLNHVSR